MAVKPGKVEVIDRGFVRRMSNLRALRGWQATVGIHGTEDERGDRVDNVQLGVWHEFGTDEIPERSFLRSSWDKRVRSYERAAAVLGGRVIDGTLTPKQAVGLVGERVLGDVVNGINAGIPPPLAESTLDRRLSKGIASTKALIETGQLKMSITVVTERKR